MTDDRDRARSRGIRPTGVDRGVRPAVRGGPGRRRSGSTISSWPGSPHSTAGTTRRPTQLAGRHPSRGHAARRLRSGGAHGVLDRDGVPPARRRDPGWRLARSLRPPARRARSRHRQRGYLAIPDGIRLVEQDACGGARGVRARGRLRRPLRRRRSGGDGAPRPGPLADRPRRGREGRGARSTMPWSR